MSPTRILELDRVAIRVRVLAPRLKDRIRRQEAPHGGIEHALAEQHERSEGGAILEAAAAGLGTEARVDAERLIAVVRDDRARLVADERDLIAEVEVAPAA